MKEKCVHRSYNKKTFNMDSDQYRLCTIWINDKMIINSDNNIHESGINIITKLIIPREYSVNVLNLKQKNTTKNVGANKWG